MKLGVSFEWLPLAFAVAFLFCATGTAALAQAPLTAPESRGKQIYIQGTSASGKEILAYVGDDSIEVPGSTMACASCHGFNGQGKPEGGIDPSNITWEALTKPYGVTHSSGRRHPAYTDRGIELAVTRGLDPAGHKLLSAMPRYQMSKEDLADLLVYLKRLGTDSDSGITDDRIVIGTVLPPKGPLSEMGQAVQDVLAASFAELNAQGGIYNRKLELKVVEPPDTESTRVAVARFLKDEKVFALTAAFLAGVEQDVVSLVAEQEMPLIGPLTLDPKIDSPLNRQVFYLLSGSPGQARALVKFIAGKSDAAKDQSLAVVYERDDFNTRIVDAVKKQAEQDGLKPLPVYDFASGNFDAAATIKRVRDGNPATVFFLGNATNLVAFMNEAARVTWFPQVLSGPIGVSADIFNAPAGFDGKLFFPVPTAPSDQTAEAVKEYRALADKYKLPQKYLAAQILASAAAKVLIEGLKRTGKDVSRERLVQVLEGFYDYKTGLTPPLTWGPNRRIGAMGAYIVSVDLKAKKLVAASGWVGIN